MREIKRHAPWIAAIALPFLAATVIYIQWTPPDPLPVEAPVVRAKMVEFVPQVPELPPSPPSAATPTLVELASDKVDLRVKALAAEMAKMWTRDAEQLVTVIDDAARSAPEAAPPVTLLLAIAHAETNGMILDVSEAGAVGLAQATPIALRQEEIDGKLFVTADYLIGARAYIMKKPLGDADTIASIIVDKDDAKSRAKAKALLKSAMDLRREGVEELELLRPFGSKRYFAAIETADEHNLAALKRLKRLLESGSRREIRAYRDEVRREYRAMKQTQLSSWVRYQKDLIAKRDAMLEQEFGMPAARVKKEQAYDASEWLGENLDVRFSARMMAAFLVRHLDRKHTEAKKLAKGKSDAKIEEMTAALYNGGSHNVKRMLAGLIGSLPETQRYMKKVPATRRRLDQSIISGTSVDANFERALR